MNARARALFAAMLLCWSMSAHAHRFHAAITDISFNAKTGSTEIIHTYMAHDIEALLANLYQRQFDLTQPEDEAVLRKYVEKQFYLEGPDRRRLPIRWVGLNVDSKSVVIYRELEQTPLTKIAVVHDQVLIDFLSDQINTVNLSGDSIRSLTFDQKNTEQRVP